MAPRKKKTDEGTGDAKAPEAPPVPFEKALEALEAIVRRLEGEPLGIEDAMAEYEKGLEALRACRRTLDQAERRLEVLVREEGGKAVTKPFAPEGLEPAPARAPDAGAGRGPARGAAKAAKPEESGDEEEAEDGDEDGGEGGEDGEEEDEFGPPDATSKKDGYLL